MHESQPDANIIGVAVQAMSRGGYEVILGSKKDPTFGPAMMFGMGGTGVELYRDVAVDFPPHQPGARPVHDPEHQGQPVAARVSR